MLVRIWNNRICLLGNVQVLWKTSNIYKSQPQPAHYNPAIPLLAIHTEMHTCGSKRHVRMSINNTVDLNWGRLIQWNAMQINCYIPHRLLSETCQTKRYASYDCFYIKLKSRQNNLQ